MWMSLLQCWRYDMGGVALWNISFFFLIMKPQYKKQVRALGAVKTLLCTWNIHLCHHIVIYYIRDIEAGQHEDKISSGKHIFHAHKFKVYIYMIIYNIWQYYCGGYWRKRYWGDMFRLRLLSCSSVSCMRQSYIGHVFCCVPYILKLHFMVIEMV